MTILSALYVDRENELLRYSDRLARDAEDKARTADLEQLRMGLQYEKRMQEVQQQQQEMAGQVNTEQQTLENILTSEDSVKNVSSGIFSKEPSEMEFLKQKKALIEGELDKTRYGTFDEFKGQDFLKGIHARFEAHNRNIRAREIITENNRFTDEAKDEANLHYELSKRAVKNDLKETLGLSPAKVEEVYDRFYGRAEKSWLERNVDDTIDSITGFGEAVADQEGFWNTTGFVISQAADKFLFRPYQALAGGIISTALQAGLVGGAVTQTALSPLTGKPPIPLTDIVTLILEAPAEPLKAMYGAITKGEDVPPELLNKFAKGASDDPEIQKWVKAIVPHMDPTILALPATFLTLKVAKSGAYGLGGQSTAASLVNDILGVRLDPGSYIPTNMAGLAYRQAIKKADQLSVQDVALLNESPVPYGPGWIDPSMTFDERVALESQKIIDDVSKGHLQGEEASAVAQEIISSIKNNVDASEEEWRIANNLEERLRQSDSIKRETKDAPGSPSGPPPPDEPGGVGVPKFTEPIGPPLQPIDKLKFDPEVGLVYDPAPVKPAIAGNTVKPDYLKIEEGMSGEEMSGELDRLLNEAPQPQVTDVVASGGITSDGELATMRGIPDKEYGELARAVLPTSKYGKGTPYAEMSATERSNYLSDVDRMLRDRFPADEYGTFGSQQRAEWYAKLHGAVRAVWMDVEKTQGSVIHPVAKEFGHFFRSWLRNDDSWERYAATASAVRRKRNMEANGTSFVQPKKAAAQKMAPKQPQRPGAAGPERDNPPPIGVKAEELWFNRPGIYEGQDTEGYGNLTTRQQAKAEDITARSELREDAKGAPGPQTKEKIDEIESLNQIGAGRRTEKYDPNFDPDHTPGKAHKEGQKPPVRPLETDGPLSKDDKSLFTRNRGADFEATQQYDEASGLEPKKGMRPDEHPDYDGGPEMDYVDAFDAEMGNIITHDPQLLAAKEMNFLESVTGQRMDDGLRTRGTANPFTMDGWEQLTNMVRELAKAGKGDERIAAGVMAVKQQQMNKRLAEAVLTAQGDERAVSLLMKGMTTEGALWQLASEGGEINKETRVLLDQFNYRKGAVGGTEHQAVLSGMDASIKRMLPGVQVQRKGVAVHNQKLAKQYLTMDSSDARTQFAKNYTEAMGDPAVIEKKRRYSQMIDEVKARTEACL